MVQKEDSEPTRVDGLEQADSKGGTVMKISEDWQAVILGFVLVVLAWVGVLGKAAGLINIPW